MDALGNIYLTLTCSFHNAGVQMAMIWFVISFPSYKPPIICVTSVIKDEITINYYLFFLILDSWTSSHWDLSLDTVSPITNFRYITMIIIDCNCPTSTWSYTKSSHSFCEQNHLPPVNTDSLLPLPPAIVNPPSIFSLAHISHRGGFWLPYWVVPLFLTPDFSYTHPIWPVQG